MLGALDMFSIGIGPSSSHTIGPMKAACKFISLLEEQGQLKNIIRVKANLYGSLALTGVGHGTIFAVLNGLCGEFPETVDPDLFILQGNKIKQEGCLNLLGKHKIQFNFNEDFKLNKTESLPGHPNGMMFSVWFENGDFYQKQYFSIGGGFILDQDQMQYHEAPDKYTADVPYKFTTANELFGLCKQHNISIAELVTQNELKRKTIADVRREALGIIQVMHESAMNSIKHDGELPGGLKVKRRAKNLYEKLTNPAINMETFQKQRLLAMAFAIGVNEENAAFRRIVTAPTNGAAGTIPGVLEYYRDFCDGATEDKLVEFILTAGAIGVLYKVGASISAADVGCQGEIGVASSMAAAALTAVLGGSLIQIEKAAEIAMEHSLGMTCDPVNGLVQIPCIERNGVAASRAIDIARLSLLEDYAGLVSLDQVIKTMLQTGRDMSNRYKETALAGLAVNIVNC